MSVDQDSATNTSSSPSFFGFSIKGGIAPVLHQGDHSSLDLLANANIAFVSNYEVVSSSLGSSSYDDKYAYYSSIIPSFFVGLEPVVNLSSNFCLFSRFGLNFVINPPTKTVDRYNTFFNYDDEVFPLDTKKDGTFGFSFDGLLLGVRYWF